MLPVKPERPIEYAEKQLVHHILNGKFIIGDRLPPERELSSQLGVTRQTLREAMRRLEQEGWLLVQHGKPTIVRDFWREGGLGVLGRIIRYQGYIKPAFITNLLEFRLLLAPTYTREAVIHNAPRLLTILEQRPEIGASAIVFGTYDWSLQRELTVLSTNVIYAVILNDFARFYEKTALIYFQRAEARAASYQYYVDLCSAAAAGDGDLAYRLTVNIMKLSVDHWRHASEGLTQIPFEQGSSS